MSKVVLITGAGRGYGPAIARLFTQRGWTVAAPAVGQDALAMQRVVDEVYREHGRLDALVTLPDADRDGALLAVTQDEWLDAFHRNVHMTFFAIQAAARYMVLDRRGRIVNVAALAGLQPARAQAAFAASMGALIALTKALAAELAPKQIAVNAVTPGSSSAERVPLERGVSPEDVAELVVFLASDDASYVTGEVYKVDGGLAGRR